MGNQGPTQSESLKKRPKVIIIGGSFAGLTLAQTLMREFEVLLIDQKEYYENKEANYCCLTDPQWLGKITIKYQDLALMSQGGLKFI